MRQVMTELVRKVPSQEWRQRMQRALTTLELYKRENLRLRQDLQQGAATGAERPGGAVRFEADRGVQDAMVAQLDEVRAKEAQLQDELRVARKARAPPAGAAAGAPAGAQPHPANAAAPACAAHPSRNRADVGVARIVPHRAREGRQGRAGAQRRAAAAARGAHRGELEAAEGAPAEIEIPSRPRSHSLT